MNPLLRRILKVLGCIIGFTYLPYLFGKMFNALIYSKLGSFWATHNVMENWACGFGHLFIIMILFFIGRRICNYIKYGD